MKLIIDTNRIIAALVKDGASRRIILFTNIEFYSPEFTLEEINKYKSEIIEKADINEEQFDKLLNILLDEISIIPNSIYGTHLSKAKSLVRDVGDAPFIALALAIDNEGIWSEDKDFREQNMIKIWATSDILDSFSESL